MENIIKFGDLWSSQGDGCSADSSMVSCSSCNCDPFMERTRRLVLRWKAGKEVRERIEEGTRLQCCVLTVFLF